MRRVLLIADLEGITGVDDVTHLVMGTPGYPAAARRMTEEVAMVARLLRAHGVEAVRISDAHHSGADGNIDPAGLPDGCELLFDTVDMYAGALLNDVDAVACVGMHALGASPGFGAHTVSVNTEWTLGDELLTESRVVQLLAAERGVPFWFTAGDDVLRRQLPADVPFVETKLAASRGKAVSRPLAQVEAEFRAVLRRAPVTMRPLPPQTLRVRFQTRAEAAAANAGTLIAPTVRELPPMADFHAQFLAACRMIESASDAMVARIAGLPGTIGWANNAARLLLAAWE